MSSSPSEGSEQDVQYDAHVKAREDEVRFDDSNASLARTGLLNSTGWEAAARFTDGTLDAKGVRYYEDTNHGRIIASVMLDQPNSEDTNLSTLHSDIPEDQKILVFYLRCPIDRDGESSLVEASFQVVPLGDDRFRLLSFGVSDNEIPLSLRLALAKDVINGMNDFMMRVATRRGKICTVVDSTNAPALIDMLFAAGYRIRKPAPGEDRGYARVERDQEILRAVHTLTRYGVRASISHIEGETSGLFPVERLTQRDTGQPYMIDLEKIFRPLKADTKEALTDSLIDSSWGIVVI